MEGGALPNLDLAANTSSSATTTVANTIGGLSFNYGYGDTGTNTSSGLATGGSILPLLLGVAVLGAVLYFVFRRR